VTAVPKPQQLTRRQRWAPYVCDLKNRVYLRDWQIAIYEDAPAASEALASIEPVYGRKWAALRLSDRFLSETQGEQRHTIAHELIHCHFAPLQRLIEANDEMTQGYKMAIEYAVDGLADAIAPLLPLPPPGTRSQS
jgi:hypothetical protein